MSESEPKESPLVGLMREELSKSEQRINSSVETQVRQLFESKIHNPSDLDSTLRSIKEEINKLGNNAIKAVGETVRLPDKLREVLRTYRDQDWPAFFILLPAIVKENATSTKDIRKIEKEYAIPVGWEEGLTRLLSDGVLQGDFESFHLTPQFEKPLEVWVDRNWHIIRNLTENYSMKREQGAISVAGTLAKNFDF